MHSTSTAAIQASDFSDLTTDTDRNDWTEGKMRHVVAALDGQLVAITVDKMTGHTMFGVRLVGVVAGGGGGHARVLIESRYEDGTVQVTTFLLFRLGPVITPIPQDRASKDAKWAALDTWRDERSAALEIARNTRTEQGLIGGVGRLVARPTAHNVAVSWEPDRERARRQPVQWDAPQQRFWYTHVTLSQAADVIAERKARVAALNTEGKARKTSG